MRLSNNKSSIVDDVTSLGFKSAAIFSQLRISFNDQGEGAAEH